MPDVAVTLFTGPHCRLCDEAFDLVAPLIRDSQTLKLVDVTISIELKKRYGLKIPVLYREDKEQELCWPFDREAAAKFLG